MPMNRAHRRLCSSEKWAAGVRDHLLPWALENVELGEDIVEIGPGYGANLRVLIERVPRVTAVEIDGGTAALLRDKWGDRARVLHADGADMPLPDAAFSAVVCFTMLHHVPTDALQDRIFAEAFPGTAAGRDVRRGRQPAELPLPAAAHRGHHEHPRPRRTAHPAVPGRVHRHRR
ncbi:class I SAM-dependent methyltransferase [Streptomyces sp. NPDC053499]|uniref:class I SAM-dependent methyltransferase n=1 Tax=Streptomyces sp. NPDC053499 TaxID=3365707 RepID=UPI0037D85EBA